MYGAPAIREYISHIPDNVIVFTRDVLHLGTRSAVDQTMSRLVGTGQLVRVAFGAFVTPDSIIPPYQIIMEQKAQAFAKTTMTHETNLPEETGIPVVNKEKTFLQLPFELALDAHLGCIKGCSSALRTADGFAVLKGVAQRKFFLGNSLENKEIRALWYMGKKAFERLDWSVLSKLHVADSERLVNHARWMPWWMSDRFIKKA